MFLQGRDLLSKKSGFSTTRNILTRSNHKTEKDTKYKSSKIQENIKSKISKIDLTGNHTSIDYVNWQHDPSRFSDPNSSHERHITSISDLFRPGSLRKKSDPGPRECLVRR